jgi:hypothetical protein
VPIYFYFGGGISECKFLEAELLSKEENTSNLGRYFQTSCEKGFIPICFPNTSVVTVLIFKNHYQGNVSLYLSFLTALSVNNSILV